MRILLLHQSTYGYPLKSLTALFWYTNPMRVPIQDTPDYGANYHCHV
jgi:hypothetical protein